MFVGCQITDRCQAMCTVPREAHTCVAPSLQWSCWDGRWTWDAWCLLGIGRTRPALWESNSPAGHYKHEPQPRVFDWLAAVAPTGAMPKSENGSMWPQCLRLTITWQCDWHSGRSTFRHVAGRTDKPKLLLSPNVQKCRIIHIIIIQSLSLYIE